MHVHRKGVGRKGKKGKKEKRKNKPGGDRIMHYIICLLAKFQDNLRTFSREHNEDEVCNAFQALYGKIGLISGPHGPR
jgi:hypothetical protein